MEGTSIPGPTGDRPLKRTGEEPSLASYCLDNKIRRQEDLGASYGYTETVLRSNPKISAICSDARSLLAMLP